MRCEAPPQSKGRNAQNSSAEPQIIRYWGTIGLQQKLKISPDINTVENIYKQNSAEPCVWLTKASDQGETNVTNGHLSGYQMRCRDKSDSLQIKPK